MPEPRVGGRAPGLAPALGLAAVAGAARGLCWLPLGLAPAMPLAALAALIGLRRVDTLRQAVRFGLIYGAATYLVGSHFLLALVAFSPLGILFYPLAVLYVLPFAVLEAVGALLLERRLGVPRALGFAMLATLMERGRATGDLSMPADLLSHGFGTHPAWLAWSAWIGPFGFTLLVFLTAMLLEAALAQRAVNRKAVALTLGAVALWAAPPLTDAVTQSSGPDAPELRVGIVQPAFPVEWKLDRARWPEMRRSLVDLTLRIAPTVDLVIWPETARPGPVVWKDGEFADPPMQALAGSAGVPILYGCEIARFAHGRLAALYNGAALVRPEGPSQWYGKQRLVPFAEGMPFASWISGASGVGWNPSSREKGRRSILTLLGNFSPGPPPQVFQVGPARIGVLICYEGLYPGLARAYRMAGANSLCVITNDTWWGRSLFPELHARVVAARARELDVPVLRAAHSGVSSMTDRRGALTDSTRLYEATTLLTRVLPVTTGPTFYARHGDLVFGLEGLVLAFFAVRAWIGRIRPATP